MNTNRDHRHGTGRHYLPGCEGCAELNRAARLRARANPAARARELAKSRIARNNDDYRAQAAARQAARREDSTKRARDNATAVASQAARRERLRVRPPEEADRDFLRLNPSGEQACRECRKSLGMRAFARNRSAPSGRAMLCMVCVTRKRRSKHAEKVRRSALERGLDPTVCAYCTSPFSDVNRAEFDHFIPVALGGAGDVSNLVPACMACNRGVSGKFDSDPWEWIARRFPERTELLRGAQTYRQVGES